jgi:hypothetical protein
LPYTITAITQNLSRSQKLPISRAYQLFSTRRILAIPAGNLAFSHDRHLQSCSPQRPMQDIEIKSGIFAGERIIVEADKLIQ